MTGRDLIIYILANNLEDEPVFKDGSFVGYITVEKAAAKMNVGTETICAWITMGMLDYIRIGDTYLVNANVKVVQ